MIPSGLWISQKWMRTSVGHRLEKTWVSGEDFTTKPMIWKMNHLYIVTVDLPIKRGDFP